MSKFTAGIEGISWYNPANREKASLIAKDIELELEELKKAAIISELAAVYKYHRKRLSILQAKLTRLCNKDTDEWLKNEVAKATGVGRRA